MVFLGLLKLCTRFYGIFGGKLCPGLTLLENTVKLRAHGLKNRSKGKSMGFKIGQVGLLIWFY